MGYTIGHLHGDEHRPKQITPNVAQRDKGMETMKALRDKEIKEKSTTHV